MPTRRGLRATGLCPSRGVSTARGELCGPGAAADRHDVRGAGSPSLHAPSPNLRDSAGVGRAVVPVHLLDPSMPVRVVPGFRPIDVPVFLHYHHQPYYTRLQQAVLETLLVNCPPLLRTNRAGVALDTAVADDALVAAQARQRTRAGQ